MLAPEALQGHRIVADPSALDALVAGLPPSATAVRFAPDEALVVGLPEVAVDDPDAIIEAEAGFVALTVDRAIIERHVEWVLPASVKSVVGQGAIAGVPAKLLWLADGRAWVVVQAGYLDELLDRLR